MILYNDLCYFDAIAQTIKSGQDYNNLFFVMLSMLSNKNHIEYTEVVYVYDAYIH